MEDMNVRRLVEDAYRGEIVLPDFQRSFIWEPEDIRELLVSVLGNYFIGSMLILQYLRDDSPFALRLLEGVKEINPEAKIQSIVNIILDGQQRTTALFYAMYEPDLPLKGRKSAYRFYLDIEEVLKEDKDWDKTVTAVNLRDKRRLAEVEKKGIVIPFTLLKDISALIEKFKDTPDLGRIVAICNDFMTRPINTVYLPRGIELERIVETFERINRTGEPLSVFELLTAKLYKEGIKLRDILEATQSKYKNFEFVAPESILKVMALMRGKEPKRRNILELKAKDFKSDWAQACQSLDEAIKRATELKIGYGVLEIKKWLPYTTMLVTLAALLHFLKQKKLDTAINYQKIDTWYWTSVFSNRYDQAADTTSTSDFNLVGKWISGNGAVPDFIKKFDPKSVDLDVEKQSAAIYRGVINLVTLSGALDFKTGLPPQFEMGKVQDDHIFPKKYKTDLVSNRTLITSNAEKGDKTPSEYFGERLKVYGEDKLKQILKTHLIPEDALDYLLKDDKDAFIIKRRENVMEAIKARTKKSQALYHCSTYSSKSSAIKE